MRNKVLVTLGRFELPTCGLGIRIYDRFSKTYHILIRFDQSIKPTTYTGWENLCPACAHVWNRQNFREAPASFWCGEPHTNNFRHRFPRCSCGPGEKDALRLRPLSTEKSCIHHHQRLRWLRFRDTNSQPHAPKVRGTGISDRPVDLRVKLSQVGGPFPFGPTTQNREGRGIMAVTGRKLLVAQLAQQKRWRRSYIYDLLAAGLLDGTKKGRTWLIDEASLNAYLERRGRKQAEKIPA